MIRCVYCKLEIVCCRSTKWYYLLDFLSSLVPPRCSCCCKVNLVNNFVCSFFFYCVYLVIVFCLEMRVSTSCRTSDIWFPKFQYALHCIYFHASALISVHDHFPKPRKFLPFSPIFSNPNRESWFPDILNH